ncbi:MAG: ATP-binding protein [Aquabacterium sp.]|nr:ATP-binding protein [Aquabacterium sp.]
MKSLTAMIMISGVMVFALAHWLTQQPKLPFGVKASPEGWVKIQSTELPNWHHLDGAVLLGLQRDPSLTAPVNVLMLRGSTRWISAPEQKQQHLDAHRRMNALLEGWDPDKGLHLQLVLLHETIDSAIISAIGWSGLTPLFWLLTLLALMAMVAGSMALLTGITWVNVAFALLAWSQAGQLIFIGTETQLNVFAPDWFLLLDAYWRPVLDLVGASAVVQIAALLPAPLPKAKWYGSAAGLLAIGLCLGMNTLSTAFNWWTMQLACMLLIALAVGLMTASYRLRPHPFTLVTRRFLVLAVLTWALLSVAVWGGITRPDMQFNLTNYGGMAWQVFAAMTVLLLPYLSHSRPILQEFSLLAASSTVAASLDVLFVAAFSLGQFTSMTLALFCSLGLYLIIRRWLMTHMPGRDTLTMERLFQRLYRIAREVARRPDTLDGSVMSLMREMFDPLAVTLVPGEVAHASLRGNGSVLLVPLPTWQGRVSVDKQVLILTHAHKGQRLFTAEDARLAERVMDQLHRALSFDHAVEQGRSEERLRIAQDLHDDIGARLLTLMYQAPNAEIEEYIRHTIQDLKTLTRGLAAQSHSLSAAASEWKRDLSHRLSAAHCELDWQMSADVDVTLTMVQWSGLTRIIRELVSNAISHAKAGRVQVLVKLENDQLTLSVQDNGASSQPSKWSHGLGLGGIRKRAKQLGGTVQWLEVAPHGIRCEVLIESFSGSANPANPTHHASH